MLFLVTGDRPLTATGTATEVKGKGSPHGRGKTGAWLRFSLKKISLVGEKKKLGRKTGSVCVTAQRPAITDSAPKCCSSLSIGHVSVVLRVGLVVSGDNGRLILARPSVYSIGKLKDGHPECHDC
jgi:hypothetical protein